MQSKMMANPCPLGLMGFGMTTILLNLHHAVFFSLEALSWIHLPHTLLRIAVSSAVSVGFIWIIARIFTAKLPLRV